MVSLARRGRGRGRAAADVELPATRASGHHQNVPAAAGAPRDPQRPQLSRLADRRHRAGLAGRAEDRSGAAGRLSVVLGNDRMGVELQKPCATASQKQCPACAAVRHCLQASSGTRPLWCRRLACLRSRDGRTTTSHTRRRPLRVIEPGICFRIGAVLPRRARHASRLERQPASFGHVGAIHAHQGRRRRNGPSLGQLPFRTKSKPAKCRLPVGQLRLTRFCGRARRSAGRELGRSRNGDGLAGRRTTPVLVASGTRPGSVGIGSPAWDARPATG